MIAIHGQTVSLLLVMVQAIQILEGIVGKHYFADILAPTQSPRVP